MYPKGYVIQDKYRIEEPIGSGGFADVYLATLIDGNFPKALKILRTDEGGVSVTQHNEISQRFQQEIKLTGIISNANVIGAHDVIRINNNLILVMEYAPGGTLQDRLDKTWRAGKPIPVVEGIGIAIDIVNGLNAIHKKNVVHRDLKPTNILFDAEDHAKIADLGVAQVPGQSQMRDELTGKARPHPGTPKWMSPEQESSTKALEPSSDIYTLGLILFEVFTGRTYNKDEGADTIKKQCPKLPEDLIKLLANMLQEEPRKRLSGNQLLPRMRKLFDNMTSHSSGPVVDTRVSDNIEIDFGDGFRLDFVLVRGGEFIMGSDPNVDPDATENEMPAHRLFLPDFWIGRDPITYRQFAAYMRDRVVPTTAEQEGSSLILFENQYGSIGGANWHKPFGDLRPYDRSINSPVMMVSFEDALEFCKWATRKASMQIVSAKIRLPSEAEWEKAARGTNCAIWPWGNGQPTPHLCNFNNQNRIPTAVGNFSTQGDSVYGCADMAGNVWEWTLSLYRPYPYNPSDGREDLTVHRDERVLRGGAYNLNAAGVRCAIRSRLYEKQRDIFSGFRVCLVFDRQNDKQLAF